MINRLRLLTMLALSWLALGIPSGAQTHDHSAMTATDGEFNPYVVSDNRGGFYVAYIQRKNGASNVMLQHSGPSGAPSVAVQINNRSGDAAVRNENPPKIAVGPKNELYVVWASERERWKGNIRFARSLNGGKTFEPAIDLNSDASQQPISRAFQSIAVDAKGRILIAWIDERRKTPKARGAEIWMTTSEDGGKTFSSDRRIVSDVCECCRTALGIDSNGSIYLSYRRVPPAGPMFRDIAVARSDDGGKTFNSTIVSQDRWELNGCPIAGATMTVTASGRVHVAWFTQIGETPRLYIASSIDHGASFSTPTVFDPTQKLAKHAHAVAASGSQVLIAWDDLNGKSLVRWGLFDTTTKSMRILGSRNAASYPIVAMSGGRIGVVTLQPDQPRLFRSFQVASIR